MGLLAQPVSVQRETCRGRPGGLVPMQRTEMLTPVARGLMVLANAHLVSEKQALLLVK